MFILCDCASILVKSALFNHLEDLKWSCSRLASKCECAARLLALLTKTDVNCVLLSTLHHVTKLAYTESRLRAVVVFQSQAQLSAQLVRCWICYVSSFFIHCSLLFLKPSFHHWRFTFSSSGYGFIFILLPCS